MYVEVFGGAGSLLFAKSPAELDIYNDLDSGLVNFFRVLRDPDDAARLSDLLRLTPYSREEWQACLRGVDANVDPVESARRFYVMVTQSFNCNFTGNSWRHSVSIGTNAAQSYHHNIERLPYITQRLQGVQVEHDDFARLIAAYDAPNALFYCDPPYLAETRRSGTYRREMSRADHERLLKAVTTCRGKSFSVVTTRGSIATRSRDGASSRSR